MVRKGLGLAVLVVFAAAAAAEDAAKAELDRLQGEWQLASMTRDGKEVPAERIQTITRVIKGDHYRLLQDGKEVFEGVMTLNPTRKPKTIDAKQVGSDRAALGIYELEGDTQKICLAQPGKDRPAEFSSTEGSGRVLTVWKRKK
jgi:uncharacterized protein (TIGR03067 family)